VTVVTEACRPILATSPISGNDMKKIFAFLALAVAFTAGMALATVIAHTDQSDCSVHYLKLLTAY
jgi:hypothetical protein